MQEPLLSSELRTELAQRTEFDTYPGTPANASELKTFARRPPERSGAERYSTADAIYFVTPGPFELEAPRADGSRRAPSLGCAVCWLSLLARVSRSFLRPLRSRSENSRVSIDEIARVSDGGVDQRRQARRIQRKNTRGFLI